MKVSRMLISCIFACATLISMSSVFTSRAAKVETSSQKPAIVFDLGGVLFKTNSSIVLNQQIGTKCALKYALSHCCLGSAAITKKWFAFLDTVYKMQNRKLPELDPNLIFKNESGTPLPAYLIEWILGTVRGETIFAEIEASLTKLALNENDALFMRNMSKNLLPHYFVKSRLLIEATYRFIEHLKKEGYPVYVLSNWDSDSFAIMKKVFPDVFTLFDGIMISGDELCAKPDPRIYAAFQQRYPHEQYILIDDQKDNTAQAVLQGWKTVHTKTGKPNFKKIDLLIAKATADLNQPKSGEAIA